MHTHTFDTSHPDKLYDMQITFRFCFSGIVLLLHFL